METGLIIALIYAVGVIIVGVQNIKADRRSRHYIWGYGKGEK